MNHITSGDKNIWPCVAGGVVAGAACALAAVHVIPTPAMCKPSRPQGKIVLHYFPLPAMGEPVRLLLELGGFDWEDKVVDFKTWGEGALKKQAQWGQMPFMLLEDGTQFTQSRAMVKFLSNYVTVSGTPLMPSDPMVVYEADMLIDTFEDMLNKLRKTFAIEDAAQKSAAREKLFGVWSATLPLPLSHSLPHTTVIRHPSTGIASSDFRRITLAQKPAASAPSSSKRWTRSVARNISSETD